MDAGLSTDFIFSLQVTIQQILDFQDLTCSFPLIASFGLPAAVLARILPGLSRPSGCWCSLPLHRPAAWFSACARWHGFSISAFRLSVFFLTFSAYHQALALIKYLAMLARCQRA